MRSSGYNGGMTTMVELPTLPILKAATPAEWVLAAVAQTERLLIDHAWCEHKAASTALSLIAKLPGDRVLVSSMTHLGAEELSHFDRIAGLLAARGIPLEPVDSDHYVKDLLALGRRHGPEHVVDRLLILSLVEARSCERFTLLAEAHPDPELRALYRELSFSEAGHHSMFVSLACRFGPKDEVLKRLDALAEAEADIMRGQPVQPRMH